MVMRAVICKDDPTSHGGVVLEGNMTHCPQCKGDLPIVEGLGYSSFAGVGTAVDGMKTACGAILIATTTQGFMMIDERTGKPVPDMPYRTALPDDYTQRVTGHDPATVRLHWESGTASDAK